MRDALQFYLSATPGPTVSAAALEARASKAQAGEDSAQDGQDSRDENQEQP